MYLSVSTEALESASPLIAPGAQESIGADGAAAGTAVAAAWEAFEADLVKGVRVLDAASVLLSRDLNRAAANYATTESSNTAGLTVCPRVESKGR